MNLDRAMALVAGSLAGIAPEQLPGRVRAVLLAAVTGTAPTGLSEVDVWANSQGPGKASELYQEMLQRTIADGPSGALAVKRTAAAHRATGAYYTNPAVVRYMIAQARHYLPGVDTIIDPACGAGVFLQEAHEQFGKQVRLVGLDSDPQAVQLCRLLIPEASVSLQDALSQSGDGGFDLCVGNPPYISSGLRGAVPAAVGRLAELRQRFPLSGSYKVNTYPLFIERGLQLIRPGGVLAFIVPDSFLTGRYFTGLRGLLLENTLLELVLIRRDFWEHGHVGQSVILIVRRGKAPTGHAASVRVVDHVDQLARGGMPGHWVSPSELAWGTQRRLRLVPNARDRSWLRDIESAPGHLPIGALVETYSGLIARRGQHSLLRSAHPHLAGPWAPLLRSGREIDRYRLEWAGEEVCLDPALIKSGGRLSAYRNPKLLMRQTADSLRACYDERGHFCLNNIHLLLPRRGCPDLRALLGIINSSTLDRYYRLVTMESGRAYPQVDLDLLESLPVPFLVPAAEAALAELARLREATTGSDGLRLDRRIDQAVAALYDPG